MIRSYYLSGACRPRGHHERTRARLSGRGAVAALWSAPAPAGARPWSSFQPVDGTCKAQRRAGPEASISGCVAEACSGKAAPRSPSVLVVEEDVRVREAGGW